MRGLIEGCEFYLALFKEIFSLLYSFFTCFRYPNRRHRSINEWFDWVCYWLAVCASFRLGKVYFFSERDDWLDESFCAIIEAFLFRIREWFTRKVDTSLVTDHDVVLHLPRYLLFTNLPHHVKSFMQFIFHSVHVHCVRRKITLQARFSQKISRFLEYSFILPTSLVEIQIASNLTPV